MGINDLLIAFLAFCLGLCVYGMVMLVRAVAAWRERHVRAKAGEAHPKGQSRRRLIAASGLGVLSTLLGGGLVAFITPTFDAGGTFAGYRMAVAMALLGLGIACVIVGARWDRAKGRRRCPKCWYSYEGLTADAKCPECGRIAKTERRLLRTRRKPLLYAALPLMFAAAWVSYIAPVAVTWRSYIPTTVMIAGYEWMPETVIVSRGGKDVDALDYRLYDMDQSKWQRRWALARLPRVIVAADDPATCVRACYIFMAAARDAVAPSPVLARAARRAMELLPTLSPHGANTQAELLLQFAATYGSPDHTLSEPEVDALLNWPVRPGTSDRELRHYAIMRLAPGSDRVVTTILDEAINKDGPPRFAQIEGAAALGQIVARMPGMREIIDAQTRNAGAWERYGYQCILMSSYLEPVQPGSSALARAVTIDRNTSQVIAFLDGEDKVLTSAALSCPDGYLGLHIDKSRLDEPLSRLAVRSPHFRLAAIGKLSYRKALAERNIPVLLEMIQEDRDNVAYVANGCRPESLTRAWLPLRPLIQEQEHLLRESGRLDAYYIDDLRAVLAHLDAIAAVDTSDNASEPSATP